MKADRRLSVETRSLLAAYGWRVRMLFQPEWLFKQNGRKLKRVPEDGDPWSAMISPLDPMLDYIDTGQGDTPEEAVLAAFHGRRARQLRGGLPAALCRLEIETELLTAAFKPGGFDRNVPF